MKLITLNNLNNPINYENLRQKMVEAILYDEFEYCFDRSYCSDEQWAEQHGNRTRIAAYKDVIQAWEHASIDQITKDFGDKYDYIFEDYCKGEFQ